MIIFSMSLCSHISKPISSMVLTGYFLRVGVFIGNLGLV